MRYYSKETIFQGYIMVAIMRTDKLGICIFIAYQEGLPLNVNFYKIIRKDV